MFCVPAFPQSERLPQCVGAVLRAELVRSNLINTFNLRDRVGLPESRRPKFRAKDVFGRLVVAWLWAAALMVFQLLQMNNISLDRLENTKGMICEISCNVMLSFIGSVLK